MAKRADGEGTMYKRKDGLWCAEYTDAIGKRRYVYGKTQRVVKEKLKGGIREADAGINVDGARLTVAKWFVEWLAVYAKPHIQPATYANYHRSVHMRIVPRFANVMLKDLRPDMLQRFINDMAEGGKLESVNGNTSGEYAPSGKPMGPRTLQHLKSVLSMAMCKAADLGYVARNPVTSVKLPRVQKNEVQILTIDDQRKLETALMNHRNHLAFALLLDLYTGLRAGELIALKWEDIDLDKAELHVRRSRSHIQVPGQGGVTITKGPKTASGMRTIPLTSLVC